MCFIIWWLRNKSECDYTEVHEQLKDWVAPGCPASIPSSQEDLPPYHPAGAPIFSFLIAPFFLGTGGKPCPRLQGLSPFPYKPHTSPTSSESFQNTFCYSTSVQMKTFNFKTTQKDGISR